MNSTPDSNHASTPSGYGFRRVPPKQDFASALPPAPWPQNPTSRPTVLPYNVVVREAVGGGLVVGFMDPVALMQMTCSPEVFAVAQEVRVLLDRVRAALG